MMDVEYHPECLFLVPTVALGTGECMDEECTERHFRVSVGWFVWSVHWVF